MSNFGWWRNLLGQKLTDDEMREIKHPALELYTHVTFKTVQAGALLGMVVIAPVFRLAVGPRTLLAVKETALRYGRNGAIIGLPLGPLMTYGRATSGEGINDDGMFDRAYRLRYKMQLDITALWNIIPLLYNECDTQPCSQGLSSPAPKRYTLFKYR